QSEASAAVEVVVNAVPVAEITVTGDKTFCDGGSVLLTASSATSYQWYKGGLAISGATSQTYTATTTGEYSVKVSSTTCQSEASAAVEVVVNPVPVAEITVTGDKTFCDGGSVLLTASSATSYQWYKGGIAISGATSQTYTATTTGEYSVKVSSTTCQSEASAAIEVVVNPVPVAEITVTGDKTFCDGGSVLLTASSATSYQWYKGGIAISGATSQTYTATTTGEYSVKVSSTTCQSEASAAIEVVVNAVPVAEITVTGDKTFCYGGSVLLTASSATSYQWYKGGITISGATSQSYTATTTGDYSVKVSSTTCQSEASAAVEVVVNAVPVAEITVTGDKTFCDGGSVLLTASSATSYQWYKGGLAISGATSQTYTATTTGEYSVKVSSATCESEASAVVEVKVNAVPVANISVTEPTTFCAGGHVLLTASSATSYQWYKDAIAISGATSQTYTATVAGKYSVKVSSTTCESIASATVNVIVNPIPNPPTITAVNNAVYCVGGSVVLTSSEINGNQWFKDGNPISGATLQTYTATAPGNYSVTYTNDSGCLSIASAPIRVREATYPEQPQISPSNETTFCDGGVVLLTSSSAHGNQWYKNGVLIPNATAQTYSVGDIGIYTVKVTNDAGCASAISRSTKVTVSPVPKGYNDTANPLTCTQSSFVYPLQANVDNTIKGGNAVPASFTWIVNSPVSGAINGSGNTINTNLYNPTATDLDVIYTVTPRGLNGGCDGIPFKITVRVPACIGLSIVKTADLSSVSTAGEKINYTITVKNIGTTNHHHVVLNDPLIGTQLSLSGDNGNGILERAETWIYKGIYTVTQSDIDRNGAPSANLAKIQNIATVTSTEHPIALSAIADVAILQNPGISLVKSGRFNSDFKTITYTFTIKNTGNVTLHNLILSDPKIPGLITLSGTSLAPSASMTHVIVYTVTEDEKLNGNVRNTARIDGLTQIGTGVFDISGTDQNNDTPTDVDVVRYPSAVDDYAKTKTDVEVMVPVAKNDRASLFPLDVSTVEIQMAPSHGILQMNKDGRIVYQPNKGFIGVEKFSYKINDEVGLSSNVAMVTINVVPPDLEIPNTFTPNGDGKNDTFQIIGRENYDSIDLAVFNRWGDQVYHNNNYKDEWDGAGLNEGTYFYVLKFKKAGVTTSRKSWILIKR
uniref:Ig-like domain-containing protein n=1 Tax=Pedobacter gandavensis TaxID=2679963 RepID=UPI0029317BA9